MPSTAPTNVLVSPNATSTEPSIIPSGGTINPAISSPHPTAVSIVATASLEFSFDF